MAISIGEFQTKAAQALRSGGVLDVNKSGNLHVKGTGFMGRAVLWVKDHLFPSAVRARNGKVLNAFEHSLKEAYGTPPDNLAERKAHALKANIPQTLLNLIEAQKSSQNRGKVLNVVRQAESYAAAALSDNGSHAPALPVADSLDHLLAASGRSQKAFAAKGRGVEFKFMDFTTALAKKPSFAAGRIPEAVSMEGRGDYSAPEGNRARRGEEGHFDSALLRGCMIVAMEKELPPGGARSQIAQRHGAQDLSHDEMDWLRSQYAELTQAR